MGVIDDLRAVAADLERGSSPARFVARELRLIEVGCERSNDGAQAEDYLAAAMWKRLAVEATLRVAWIVGDTFQADEAGELVIDSDQVASRCDRLRARDTLNLLGAYKAITTDAGSSVDASLVDGMTQLAAKRAPVPAPRSLRDLAVNKTQAALYTQYRLCSAVVHPGELADDDKARRLVSRLTDEVAVLAVAFARGLAQALSQ